MSFRSSLLKVISILGILAVLFRNFEAFPAQAQSGDRLKRFVNAESHKISLISPANGRVLSASEALGTAIRPQDPALALVKRYAHEFGLSDPERDLSVMKKHENGGRVMVRYQQKYQGVPVMAGELIVNTNDGGDLYSISGEVFANPSLDVKPTIDSAQAKVTALQAIAGGYRKRQNDFFVTEPELWIFDERLLRPSTRPAELVWRIDVTSKHSAMPVRELVLVSAQNGDIILHFNQVDTAWGTTMKEKKATVAATDTTVVTASTVALSTLASTYTANSTSALPGSFLCDQTDSNCAAGDSQAKAAHKYAIGTDNFYATKFNRASIDNAGMVIKSTVHYCDSDPYFGCPFYNAFWSGTQMVYGDGYGFALADDVVAHELTHGVTQYESNLFYFYQSGAINESFSDVFGEYYDQTNGMGSDGVKWQIGEDIADLGVIRSMSNPPDYGDPDKMSSPNYYTDTDDNGGVHHNSGVNNKAAYLMVDGGTFNGKTITGLGWEKVGALYYEVNSDLLTSGADYSDLYYALQQACTNVMDQHGITSSDCSQVKDVLDAVEMNGQPAPHFNPDTPLCDVGTTPNNIVFADDLEHGAGNWTFNNGPVTRWQIDSPLYGPNAHSGLHSLFGAPYPDAVSDTNTQLDSFLVPSNGYLWFAQAFEFESLFTASFDGGVLEYSTNGGSVWQDAGSLIDHNGYTGVIADGYGNPLGGRSGFVISSHGYISTRLNLSSLAGKNVTFRWRMGLDGLGLYGEDEIGGWWVDNIKVYQCGVPTTFEDVPTYYWAWSYIERLYRAGITGGCGTNPLIYCPTATVTRDQMAIFLLKGKHGASYVPPPASGVFADVPTNYWAAAWIEQLSAEGITSGCSASPAKYCPGTAVTRDQMAVFLLKAKHGSSYVPPAATGVFADVPTNYWAASWIEQLAAEGITGGCSVTPKLYCPATSVTRDQMAVFLVRNFNLP